MPARPFRPDRLAVAAFAEASQTLDGEHPQEHLARLLESLQPQADGGRPPVRWSARGERRQPRVGPAQTWLHLSAHTAGRMTCQRCLEPLDIDLRIEEQPFRFVESEAVAAELDEEVDEDLLVLSTAFDLFGLIEDELLLTLPWVPRHARCPGVPGSTVTVRLEGEREDENEGGADEEGDDPHGNAAEDGAAPAGGLVARRPSPFAGLAQLKGLRPAAAADTSADAGVDAAPPGASAAAGSPQAPDPPAPVPPTGVAPKRRRR